ncbi:DsbA family protein [Kitasatospora sp. NPDC093806]|uniref:2-hydroxychromene-2-carboxylate isomerase n=1 Tax=Kitasatospora sp. NPDC093806 TaxID=3155075 RepID=UPI00341C64A9
MAKKTKIPRFYFSLRSPYSWLLHRELTTRLPDIAEGVEWVPFCEPDAKTTEMLAEFGGEYVVGEMTRAKNMYILQDIGRLAKDRGIDMTWPVDRDSVWEVPHLGYLVAEAKGQGRAYIAACYQARFLEGRDICDPKVVGEIGDSLGVDGDLVAGAVDDPDLRAEGTRLLAQAGTDGVFGVPFFVHGFTRFWGLDRLDDFAAYMRGKGLAATSLPEPYNGAVRLGPSIDDGHAGGCG